MKFRINIQEAGSHTQHLVSMGQSRWRDIGGGRHDPETCIRAAFRFLLDREPKESILHSFDVDVISRYFPEFEAEIGGYLDV